MQKQDNFCFFEKTMLTESAMYVRVITRYLQVTFTNSNIIIIIRIIFFLRLEANVVADSFGQSAPAEDYYFPGCKTGAIGLSSCNIMRDCTTFKSKQEMETVCSNGLVLVRLTLQTGLKGHGLRTNPVHVASFQSRKQAKPYQIRR